MKIGVTGKGGVGKTTVAGALARLMAQAGQRVLALDVDSNPNLAFSLGIPRTQADRPLAVPYGLTEWREDAAGNAYVHLRQPVSQFISDYGMLAPDGVQMLVMGAVVQASIGCRCEAHAVARGITGQLISEADVVVMDMEPGLEHLGRGTIEHVNTLLIVVEPYYRALMAAARIKELADQLEIPQILAVANRVRNAQEEAAIRQYCDAHNLMLASLIPYDPTVVAAEEQGQAVLDYAPQGVAVTGLRQLAHMLQQV